MKLRVAIACVLFLTAGAARGQDKAAGAIDGVYDGTYTCAQGPRTLKLSIAEVGNGQLTGSFTFYLPPASHNQSFTYRLNGTFDAASGRFTLLPVPGGWQTPQPPGSFPIGLTGVFDPINKRVQGRSTSPACNDFQATRTGVPTGGAVPAPTAPPVTTGRGAAPTPGPLFINGVYFGHYMCPGEVPLKLVLFTPGDGNLTGYFTISVPDGNSFRTQTVHMTGRVSTTPDLFSLAAPGSAISALTNGTYNMSGGDRIAARLPGCGIFTAERSRMDGAAITSAADAARAAVATNLDPRAARNAEIAQLTGVNQAAPDAQGARRGGPITARPAPPIRPTDWPDTDPAFVEPRHIRGLATGDFSRVITLRSQFLTYIAAMNDRLGTHCPALADTSISAAANAEAGADLQGNMLQHAPSGNLANLQMQLERQQADRANGAKDGDTLYAHDAAKCDSATIKAVVANMRTFVNTRPAPLTPALTGAVPGGRQWACRGLEGAGKTIYFSILKTNSSQAAILQAWRKFVTETYHPANGLVAPFCWGAASSTPEQIRAQIAPRDQSITVIDTGWSLDN